MPRAYKMSRRTESAEETRRRIVRATYELHFEKGVAATSMRDIAERADVAVGSVYHHFPTYDDVIGACGAYTIETTPPPSERLLDGIADPAARVRALVAGVYDYWRDSPGFERVRADRHAFARLEEFMTQEETMRRRLLALAVAPRPVSKRRMALAFALLDAVVYRSLIAGGLSHRAAVHDTGTVLQQWLLGDTAAGDDDADGGADTADAGRCDAKGRRTTA